MSDGQGRRRLDPDALAAREEQRDFLLASLEDLEAEFEAGDVERDDYAALKDDYTARAAAAVRAVEEGEARVAAARQPRSPGRTALVVGAVVIGAVGAGLLVAQASGLRTSGESITGDIRLGTRDQLLVAAELGAQGEVLEAIMVYDEVLEVQPDNVEALTYRGWFLVLASLVDEGKVWLDRAVATDPDYPDARAFRAIVLNRQGDPDGALADLERLDTESLPVEVAPLIDQLRAEVEAATS